MVRCFSPQSGSGSLFDPFPVTGLNDEMAYYLNGVVTNNHFQNKSLGANDPPSRIKVDLHEFKHLADKWLAIFQRWGGR